jgi:alkanesulfonate monooxygenase SsuD/methylene tetrahydromethanopterin reductase-like flavin-dependent oxidoreductase (luciferase family)
MKVNIGAFAHNSNDWERVQSGDYSRPATTPDYEFVQRALALADLAEPLGFDGIWAPEHQGTPYGMTPNPIQTLTYFAGRTRRISLGSMVVVTPWWHPVRLAHQIAYLDIVSNGRYHTIGLGRGVSKSEFAAVGVPREESRERFDETLDILKLAFSQERFSYEGKIFKIPEMSLRPAPKTRDLFSRIYGSSSTLDSLEILSRRGMVPLFVGNKPIEEAGKEVQFVNTIRQELGLPLCQPKNVLFMYCTPTMEEARKADEYLLTANKRCRSPLWICGRLQFHRGQRVRSLCKQAAGATAVLAAAGSRNEQSKPKTPGYHPSNLMIGTPEEVVKRIVAAQKACSFSEITIVPQFGIMPYDEAEKSTKLFAKEVLPIIHKMEAPLNADALPPRAVA